MWFPGAIDKRQKSRLGPAVGMRPTPSVQQTLPAAYGYHAVGGGQASNVSQKDLEVPSRNLGLDLVLLVASILSAWLVVHSVLY